MMHLTSRKFFYSISIFALGLQMSTSSPVLASKPGEDDMQGAFPAHRMTSSEASEGDRKSPTYRRHSKSDGRDSKGVKVCGQVASSVAPDDGLDEFLAVQDYSTAYSTLRTQVGDLADDALLEYLVESNGYEKGKWKALSQARREEIVCKVSGKPWARNLHKALEEASSAAPEDELDERLASQDYAAAYLALRDQGNNEDDMSLVKYLMTVNGYDEGQWDSLSEERRVAVVTKVTGGRNLHKVSEEVVSAASDDGLDELLAAKDYPGAYRTLRAQIGGQLSDDDVMGFLVESNGYEKGKWATLSQARREEVTSRVTGKQWTMKLHSVSTSPKPAVSEEGPIPAGLLALLASKDYTTAYNSLREAHPTLSDDEIVTFLLTSNGYNAAEWRGAPGTLKLAVRKKVTGKVFGLKPRKPVKSIAEQPKT